MAETDEGEHYTPHTRERAGGPERREGKLARS